MPIESNINTKEENIRLAEKVTKLYISSDMATSDKVTSWLFMELDAIEYEDEISEKLNQGPNQNLNHQIIVRAQKNHF